MRVAAYRLNNMGNFSPNRRRIESIVVSRQILANAIPNVASLWPERNVSEFVPRFCAGQVQF